MIESSSAPQLPSPTETGVLGIFHLKRLWARAAAMRARALTGRNPETHLDALVLDATGLGREQVAQYFATKEPAFEAFERWILETTGGVPPERIARINAAVAGTAYPSEIQCWLKSIEEAPPVLSADDLAFWDENGYVVLHDAVPEETRAAAENAIWDRVHANPDDEESWYSQRQNGIMVQFFQHPAFDANRRHLRVHKAFAQLWGTADLWVTTDRAGFNVPERPGWIFPGPDLHWDVSIHQPIPFGTQGILYLTDTPPEQGAFTLVPGFHRRIGSWLASLPEGANPRQQNLHGLGSQPIGGRAGDLIIWHHALPHGSRPNRGKRPRIVQYINMYPTRWEESAIWL